MTDPLLSLADLPRTQASMADRAHRRSLLAEARSQLRFFERSVAPDSTLRALDHEGAPLGDGPLPLHATARLVHAYALGSAIGHDGASACIDAAVNSLWTQHRDPVRGGYVWSFGPGGSDAKLAYGHVFVMLAAASARQAGHPDADRLLADIVEVVERRFWDEAAGRLREEFSADWRPLSSYRGMNANMHGVEAMLAVHEATGERVWLERAGRILDFFVGKMAPDHDWRIPEHYTEDWQVDPDYSGDPMFRPRGTTPGHALEFARLALQHWDLAGRPGKHAPVQARRLTDRALADAWRPEGGLAYTLEPSGAISVPDRYWWPVTEAIGAVSSLLKCAPDAELEVWYRHLWRFADAALIDHAKGGWFPELGPDGRPASRQFAGKPDIYHSLQAALYPLAPGLSRHHAALAALD